MTAHEAAMHIPAMGRLLQSGGIGGPRDGPRGGGALLWKHAMMTKQIRYHERLASLDVLSLLCQQCWPIPSALTFREQYIINANFENRISWQI